MPELWPQRRPPMPVGHPLSSQQSEVDLETRGDLIRAAWSACRYRSRRAPTKRSTHRFFVCFVERDHAREVIKPRFDCAISGGAGKRLLAGTGRNVEDFARTLQSRVTRRNARVSSIGASRPTRSTAASADGSLSLIGPALPASAALLIRVAEEKGCGRLLSHASRRADAETPSARSIDHCSSDAPASIAFASNVGSGGATW